MDKQSISTSVAPEIIIEHVSGNLEVKGWELSEVVVKAPPSVLRLSEQDDVVHLSCDSNCAIRLPHDSTVQVGELAGNASFKLLADQLSMKQIAGWVQLRSVAQVDIETVNGNFSAKEINGDLHVARIDGNAEIRIVQGDCLLEQVSGNLELRSVEGEVNVNVDGHAHVRLGALGGINYRIQADGNVEVRIPEGTGIKFKLSSDSNAIRVKLPDHDRYYQQADVDLTVGSGEISMLVKAGGNISISSQEPEWDEASGAAGATAAGAASATDDISQQIARQVEAQIAAQMEAMTQQFNVQLSQISDQVGRSGLSPEETERIMQQARQASEENMARAQERMRRSQEKLERKLEAARRRTEQKAQSRGRHTWGFTWPPPPTPPAPPTPPKNQVTDEERLMILRMLEQKKISLSEAEMLLEALESKER